MNNINELVFILDRSGSMFEKEEDVIGGFNSIVKTQKQIEGEAYVTLVCFNDEVETIIDRVNLNEVKNLSSQEYSCGGTTALYDAIGMTIKHIQKIHKYIRKEDIPSTVTFFITTDGLENASQQFNARQVQNMIKELSANGKWEFNFLGQNIDVDKMGDDLGIEKANCMAYANDSLGTIKQFKDMNLRTTMRRNGGKKC